MEVLKGEDDLCSVEAGVSLAEREPVNTMLGRELWSIAAISKNTRTKDLVKVYAMNPLGGLI